ncbi:MAG: arsenate reductase (glutaredoxin) [Pirellulales bacterium]|nr:arsenate reductase (glutaredoxin) [Pirellulales bacterium]
MAQVTIYHNPRCSKSRQTLSLLEEQGIEPRVIEYLKHPLDEAEIRTLLSKLGKEPKDVIRRGEAVFKELDLKQRLDDPDALIAAMVANPVLIERPIVVSGRRARLGRPPENVLEIV